MKHWPSNCKTEVVLRSSTLTYALRTLRRAPVFTATVLLSLALGIGCNAAIFSVVNALFFHPAGIDHPEQVVAPRVSYQKLHLKRIDMSLPDFRDVQKSTAIFSAAAASNIRSLSFTGNHAPRRLQAAAVTWQWFDVLGAKPMLGRSFAKEDDMPGANQQVVLSLDLWRNMFGGERSVLGRTIELDRRPYRVIGVMPASFRWPSQADAWVPLGLSAAAYAENHRFDEFYTVIARLRPGISLAHAQRFMQVLTARATAGNKEVAAYAKASQWGLGLESFAELASGDLRSPLMILSASIGLVLLIACSNIAGLMLVRASGRSREMAVRSALGASTANLLSQAMTESCLLALGGTALGLLSVSALLKGLLALAPARITAGLVIEPDTYVLLFTVAAGVLSSLLFGLIPAWQAARFGKQYEALKEGGRSDTEGSRRQGIRSALVIGQVALTLVLLLGAGLLLKSLEHLRSANLGFDPSHLMTAAIDLPDTGYHEDAKQIALFRSVIQELNATPGVISAAAAEPVPFNGDHWTGSFQIEGRPDLPGDPGPHGYRGYVSPKYFEALRVPIRHGRDFTDADRAGAQPVAIVDENLAREYWQGADPIGKRIRNGNWAPWATIVGVVKHVRAYDFDSKDIRGIYYMPIYQQPVSYMNFLVRTAGDPQLMAAAISRAVHKQDALQPVFDVATPSDRISKALGPQQFAVELLGIFAAAALVLAAVGLYGVVSFNAERRTREIGIRAALGASQWQILTMIAGQGFRLTVVGLLVGCVVASVSVRAIASGFENASLDWYTLAEATLVLALVAIVAALLPAWRATRIDPIAALRDE